MFWQLTCGAAAVLLWTGIVVLVAWRLGWGSGWDTRDKLALEHLDRVRAWYSDRLREAWDFVTREG